MEVLNFLFIYALKQKLEKECKQVGILSKFLRRSKTFANLIYTSIFYQKTGQMVMKVAMPGMRYHKTRIKLN